MYSSFWFVLLCCLIIHLQSLVTFNWMIHFLDHYVLVPYNLIQGTAYLLYPVCGWIAEVYFSNFKMIKWSFVIVLICSMAGVLYSALSVLVAPTSCIEFVQYCIWSGLLVDFHSWIRYV